MDRHERIEDQLAKVPLFSGLSKKSLMVWIRVGSTGSMLIEAGSGLPVSLTACSRLWLLELSERYLLRASALET